MSLQINFLLTGKTDYIIIQGSGKPTAHEVPVPSDDDLDEADNERSLARREEQEANAVVGRGLSTLAGAAGSTGPTIANASAAGLCLSLGMLPTPQNDTSAEQQVPAVYEIFCVRLQRGLDPLLPRLCKANHLTCPTDGTPIPVCKCRVRIRKPSQFQPLPMSMDARLNYQSVICSFALR